MRKTFLLVAAPAIALGLPVIAAAEPVGYIPNVDLSAGAYTVSLGDDASYTFSLFPFDPDDLTYRTIAVQTGGSALVFGNGFLTPDEVDGFGAGATVPDDLFGGSFFATSGSAPIVYSLADDFIGLSFTSMSSTFYGYAEVAGTDLLRIAYDNTPGASIVTGQDFTVLPPAAAVPEPATWAMMIAGFGLIGAGMRRARTAVRFA